MKGRRISFGVYWKDLKTVTAAGAWDFSLVDMATRGYCDVGKQSQQPITGQFVVSITTEAACVDPELWDTTWMETWRGFLQSKLPPLIAINQINSVRTYFRQGFKIYIKLTVCRIEMRFSQNSIVCCPILVFKKCLLWI